MPLVAVKRFDSVTEAELAANLLKVSGVQSVLQKDGIPGSIGIFQGAYVLVQEKDSEIARRILGDEVA